VFFICESLSSTFHSSIANFARFGAKASTALDAPLIFYVPLIRISFWIYGRFDSRGRGLDAVVSQDPSGLLAQGRFYRL
jgi:hypothetical protein